MTNVLVVKSQQTLLPQTKRSSIEIIFFNFIMWAGELQSNALQEEALKQQVEDEALPQLFNLCFSSIFHNFPTRHSRLVKWVSDFMFILCLFYVKHFGACEFFVVKHFELHERRCTNKVYYYYCCPSSPESFDMYTYYQQKLIMHHHHSTLYLPEIPLKLA